MIKTKTPKNGESFEPVFGSCPECKKTIQRIGYFKRDSLIGYLGANCSFCNYFKAPDLNDIERPPRRLFQDKNNIASKKRRGAGRVIKPKSL